MLTTLARSVDLLAVAYVFGATVWFFFVQSFVLAKRLGRDRFVPLQMSLVGVLFKTLTAAAFLMLAASLANGDGPMTLPVVSAAVAFLGAFINAWLVVPRALRSGGRSLRETLTAEEQKSATRFAVDGGGEATRFWHRIVVLFVVVMLGGLVAHAVSIVSVAQ